MRYCLQRDGRQKAALPLAAPETKKTDDGLMLIEYEEM